jgi:hypothetical protein
VAVACHVSRNSVKKNPSSSEEGQAKCKQLKTARVGKGKREIEEEQRLSQCPAEQDSFNMAYFCAMHNTVYKRICYKV